MNQPDPKDRATTQKVSSASSPSPSDAPLRSNVETEELARTTDFQAKEAAPEVETERVPPVPRAFGRYEVRGDLGTGGFGMVFLGHDTQLNRPVAIKVLRAERQTSPADTERFLNEARRVARLKHPNIVTVYDVGLQDNQCYIVSDFVEGTSLREWLKKGRPSWQEAARIAAALAEGLAHAHAQRTVHRDVKPANIIITPDQTPVLVDFGLGLDESASTGTLRGLVAGTPAYMSPEQALGEGHRIDGRTDIYSLGVVLYEMLCGRLPFQNSKVEELMRQVREDEPQPPRQLVRDIPRELERICLKAMAKRIANRYTTAGDFAEDLRRVLTAPESRSAQASDAAGLVSDATRVDTPVPGIAKESTDSVTTRQKCPHCGLEVGVDSQFCSGCGKSLTIPRTGPRTEESGKHATPPSRKLTPTGTSSSLRRAREAERRQLTVLFCNLADSAELAERLDPEELHDVLREYQKTCTEAVGHVGGVVAQSIGDGLLVCFGYPVAYEDAPRRAARGGLAILEGIARLNKRLQREKGVQVAVRVGIHTGLVVAGELGGEKPGEPLSLVGEARNVATGLEVIAQPDTVVVSTATYKLIEGFFDCDSLGTHAVKGISRPSEVPRVLSEKEVRTRIEIAGPSGLTPLVGRDREVGLLLDRWEQVKEGTGQVAMLIGEPGIGKSRMLHEVKVRVLEEHTATDPRAVFECRCATEYQDSGLNPITDFLERYLGFRREHTPEEKVTRIEGMLSDIGFALQDAVPLFASLLSLPLDNRYPPLTLTPERLRQKTLEILVDWLRRCAEKHPVLFIVEDLHWIDASTLELLGLFVEQCETERVFLLFTFRPEFNSPWTSTHVTQVALQRLNKRQVAEMVEKRTHAKALPPEVAEQVVARSDGVPLFIEECTNMLLESGLMREEGGKYVLTGPLPEHAIPSTLQDLLMARLDRLEEAKDVAQLGATLGREFTHELLQAVSTLDPPLLETELAKLVGAELVFKKGRPPQLSYIFKHALIQDAAYQSLLKSKRQQYHQRIAEVLEQQFPETVKTQPELLAHHYAEAGVKDKAIAYWEKAGLLCRDRSANAEAIAHLKRGLQLLETLDDTPARTQQELRLQLPLGTALLSVKGYAAPEVGPVFDRARKLCDQIEDPTQRFAIMWGNWAWHVVRGDFRLCMELAAEAMAFAGQLNNPAITMEALFIPGLTMLYRADFAGAREQCGRAVREFDDLEHCRVWSAYTGQNSGVTHRCYLALALWHLGYPDQAIQMNHETLARARQVNHPFSLCYALHHTGWLQQHLRLGSQVQAAAEEETAVGIDKGFNFWVTTATLYRAAGLLQQGRGEESLPELLKGLAGYRGAGAELALPFYLSNLAEAYWKTGQPDEGLKTIVEALALANKNEDLFQEAELYRLKGEILVARSPESTEEADACFRQSLDTARRQGSKSWELRSTMSLCRLWQKQGKRDEARQALGAIFGWFTEGFNTPDLVDAKVLLDELR